MDLDWELKTIDLVLRMSFDEATAKGRLGHFDPASLENQIAIFDGIGQYPSGRPSLDDVHTTAILEMTAQARRSSGRPA